MRLALSWLTVLPVRVGVVDEKVARRAIAYAPVVGPFRMTVVLGGPGEAAGGQCGDHTFPALNCILSGGKTLKCK